MGFDWYLEGPCPDLEGDGSTQEGIDLHLTRVFPKSGGSGLTGKDTCPECQGDGPVLRADDNVPKGSELHARRDVTDPGGTFSIPEGGTPSWKRECAVVRALPVR
jgi:DnaJ-class molecular chaperone